MANNLDAARVRPAPSGGPAEGRGPDWDVAPGAHPDLVPLYGNGLARRQARRRRVLRLLSSTLVVFLASGGMFVLTQRNATSAVSYDEAVRRFETAEAQIPTVAESRARGSVAHLPPAGSSHVTRVAAPKMDVKPKQIVAKPDVMPAEGIYAYRTTGGERISLFGAHHDYPSRTFASVRHLGNGVFQIRNDVIEEHADIRTIRADGSAFMQLVQERQVEFFGKRDGARLVCEPPLALTSSATGDGAKLLTTCTDGKTFAHLTATLRDTEHMLIDHRRVDAVHMHVAGRVTGRVQGSSTDDFYLDPKTGMTVRWDRTVDTLADAFGGARMRYTEDASFVLESLVPTGDE